MIIYVNIDKNTGLITVNNDQFPDTDIVSINHSTVMNTDEDIRFEIAFNTTKFEEKMFPKTDVNLNANNN